MTIYEILHRLIDAGSGRVIHEADAEALHAHVNAIDPDVPSAEEAAAAAADAQAAADQEAADFAAFKAFQARQAQAAS